MTRSEPPNVIPLPETSGSDSSAAAGERLPLQAALAFAPLHKRALGTAVGATLGVVILLVTAYHVVVAPTPAPDLSLLSEYFYGYEVSWIGAVVGAFWAFVAGFVAGWFVAFWRNFIMAAAVFVLRTRAELMQTRDFLDHI